MEKNQWDKTCSLIIKNGKEHDFEMTMFSLIMLHIFLHCVLQRENELANKSKMSTPVGIWNHDYGLNQCFSCKINNQRICVSESCT